MSEPASEFGGKTQRNYVQPTRAPKGSAGHRPTTAERLRLMYLTGTEDSNRLLDNGEVWEGLEIKIIYPITNPFPGA